MPTWRDQYIFQGIRGEKRWVDILHQSMAFHWSHNNPDQQTLRLYQWKIIKAEMETDWRGLMCMWAWLSKRYYLSHKVKWKRVVVHHSEGAFVPRPGLLVKMNELNSFANNTVYLWQNMFHSLHHPEMRVVELIGTQSCSHVKATSHKMTAMLWCSNTEIPQTLCRVVYGHDSWIWRHRAEHDLPSFWKLRLSFLFPLSISSHHS